MDLTEIAAESARGSFSLITGTGVSTVIAALAVVVMARLLGPGGYGLYTLSLVIPSLFVAIADFGLSPAVTRYGANLRAEGQHTRVASLIRSSLLFEVAVCIVTTLFVIAFWNQLTLLVLRRQNMSGLVIVSVVILFAEVFSLVSSAFVGLDRIEKSAMMIVMREAVRVLLSPLLILVGLGVFGAITGQVAAFAVADVFGLWFLLDYRRKLKNGPGDPKFEKDVRDDLKLMVTFGLPLYVGSLVATFMSQYQNVILAYFTSNVEIGNFSATLNFGQLIAIFATPVATTLFPAFSKIDLQTGKDELRRMFDFSVRYMTILIVPLTIFIAAVSKDLIRAVYGATYGYAALYLTLYVTTFLLTCLGSSVIGAFLNGVKKTKETLKIAIVQLAVFLPAAPVAAWLFRVPGMIIIILLANLTSTIYGLWLATRKYGMHIDLRFSGMVLGVAIVSLAPIIPLILFLRLPSLATALICAIIYLITYLTLAPIFKIVRRVDIQILDPILGQIRFLNPVTKLMFAYETRLLNITERNGNAANASRAGSS